MQRRGIYESNFLKISEKKLRNGRATTHPERDHLQITPLCLQHKKEWRDRIKREAQICKTSNKRLGGKRSKRACAA